MIINKDFLKTLNPCANRYEHYLEHYADFDGSFDDFLDLENISYEDKIWVGKRVLNKNQLVHFEILCADSVLHIFEEKYPEDKRVRNCLEYLKTITNFEDLTDEQREQIGLHRNAYAVDAFYAVAANAANAAFYAANAAYYAAYSAYNAAYYAYYAANAAYYAANAAYYAANAAYYAANAAACREDQKNLNIQFLKTAGSL